LPEDASICTRYVFPALSRLYPYSPISIWPGR
jgi:hypothetical protein